MNIIDGRGIKKIFRNLLVASIMCAMSGVYAHAETLPELNQSTEAYRTYNFLKNQTVTLYSDMGVTAGGVFSINGLDKNTNIINFNNHSGFIITNVQVTLNINNLTIKGALSDIGSVIYNVASDSQVTLTNLNIEKNTVLNSSDAYGGAIYTFNPLTFTNVSFKNNAAKTTGEGSVARGGAIYARDSISLIADSDNVVLVDNYTEDSNGAIDHNAIYMANPDSSLNITAKNNGEIDIRDNIKGESGYKVNITGDGTGKVGLNDSIYKAGEINVSNVDVTMADGETENHKLDNLKIGDNVNFILDADMENQVADTVTSRNGEGTLYVSELSMLSSPSANIITLQVLKDAGNIVLNIDKLSSNIYTQVEATMYNSSILAESVTLGTTDTLNDSIVITGQKDVLYEMVKDNEPLHMIKNFIFNTTTEYNLTKDLENSPQETMLSIYNLSDAKNGVINANNHSMFKLNKPVTSVNLTDITIKNAHSDTDGSVANLTYDTATFNATNSTLTNNSSDGNGGAIYVKTGNLSLNNSTLSENTSGGDGGAVYVTDNSNISFTNTDFKDNTAGGRGGAIYTNSTITITADNGSSTLEGNTDSSGNNAIYSGSEGNINLTAQNGGEINIKDKISGDEGYRINISGSKNSNINLENSIENANITLSGSNLNLSKDDLLKGNTFNANGGNLNMINGEIGNTDFSTFTSKNKTNVKVDIDLASQTMDRITSGSYENIKGTINVSRMNLLSDSKKKYTKIYFADKPIQKHVTTTVKSVAYSKVYRYIVNYNSSNGYFMFNRGSDNDPVSFNPSVLAPSVAQQVAYMNQLQNYNAAMYHNDTYMTLPKDVRLSMIRNGVATEDFDTSQGVVNHIQIPEEVRSIWVRPYASFESIPLKRGPKVSAINYGTMAGGESDMIQLSHGFTMVYGGYLSYNGNNYHYSDVHAVQQGATLGAIMYLYKGNFFNTLTANVGWMINDSDTIYGSDTMNIIMSGFADKIGYNFEINRGKVIIQPSIMFGYTYVYSTNYTTANDVKIDADPLHAIHFIPGLKIIGNLANGWQPYACINIVCNFIDKTHITANNIQLPEMSVDPYVEYGLGLQKRWSDKYSGFAQATVRNGGRRGGALLFGFRCMLGKLKTTVFTPHEDPKPKKTIFKKRKSPDITVDEIKKSVKRAKAEKVSKPKSRKKLRFNLKNLFKNERRKVLYQYNTDVSARVVTDVYEDGVIITSLDGLKSETQTVYADNNQTQYEKADDKGIIEVEENIKVNKGVNSEINNEARTINRHENTIQKTAKQAETKTVKTSDIKTKMTKSSDIKTTSSGVEQKNISKTEYIKRLIKKIYKNEARTQGKLKKQVKPHKYSDFILEILDIKF